MRKLIMAAMAEEEAEVLRELSDLPSTPIRYGRAIDRAGRVYREANGSEIIVIQSGMGPVNAALSLALIHEHHPVDAVYLLGVAGALREDLAIGDLIVADRVIQHDSFSSLDIGNFRMRPGSVVFTAADGANADFAQEASRHLVDHLCAHDNNLAARRGVIASGNEFVGTTSRKRAIASIHPDILVVDMEAAGVSQTAGLWGIPFVVAKTVADRLAPDGTIEQDFQSCLRHASQNAARVVHVIRRE